MKVFIRDFDSRVVPGSVRLFLDGEELAPLVVTDHPDGVHAEYPHRLSLTPGTTRTARVEYSEDQNSSPVTTIEWSFYVEPLTHDTLFIETEDFNFSTDGISGGLHANVGDPDCSLLGRDAVRGIDYYESDDSNSQPAYRSETGVETRPLGTLDGTRAERTNACDYAVGSNDAGDWYNYTRHFGHYYQYFTVYLRASSVTGGRVRLDSVENPRIAAQLTTHHGAFHVTDTLHTNRFTFTPLRDASSNLVLLPLCADRTFRLTGVEGIIDLNYLAFVPFAEIDDVPHVFGINPPPGSDYARAPLIHFRISDWASHVPASSVKLFFDCLDVTAQASITQSNSQVFVSYQAPQSHIGAQHIVHVQWRNTRPCGLQEESYTWSYVAGPYDPQNNLFIEAEDFNTAGGDFLPSKPGVAFNTKRLYNTLGATPGIDYNDAGDAMESNLYRAEGNANVPHVNMIAMSDTTSTGSPRPGFETLPDFKIGWTNPNTDWYNYTRNFGAASDYEIYIRASHGDGTQTIGGAIDLLDDPSLPTTTNRLGTFRAPATGGWDTFTFIPLRDSANQIVRLPLSGVNTLRYTVEANGGDINYLMFVPVPNSMPSPPFITTRRCDAAGLMHLTFHGTLQFANDIAGPWTTVTNAMSPWIVTGFGANQRFWRVAPPD